MTDAATIAALVSGTVTGVGAIGGGVAWVWGKIESRFKLIEADLKKANTKLRECQARDSSSRNLMSNMLLGMKMLADEVAILNPSSPALIYFRHILEQAFPVEASPSDMIETLDQID